ELFRTVRGFLNKLTAEMFNQLMKQVKELHIDTEAAVSACNRERLQDELEKAKNKAHRKTRGNVKLFGELFKMRMLTESIIHNCV
ncbi:eukaryotic translation initiation factor 4 gamma 3 isoform X3, partial [Silurus meridionalis]